MKGKGGGENQSGSSCPVWAEGSKKPGGSSPSRLTNREHDTGCPYHNHELAITSSTRQIKLSRCYHTVTSHENLHQRLSFTSLNELIAHVTRRSLYACIKRLDCTQDQRSIMLLLLHINKNNYFEFIASARLNWGKTATIREIIPLLYIKKIFTLCGRHGPDAAKIPDISVLIESIAPWYAEKSREIVTVPGHTLLSARHQHQRHRQ